MARFHFDVIDGSEQIDDVGSELPSLVDAKVEGLRLAGEMLRQADRQFLSILAAWKVRVRDAQGVVQFEVSVTSQDGALRTPSYDDDQEDLLRRFDALVIEGREAIRISRNLKLPGR